MSTDLVPLFLAAMSGGVVALLLTLFGGGGSVLAVPLLLYVVGVRDPHVAIGVSAAGVALNALTARAPRSPSSGQSRSSIGQCLRASAWRAPAWGRLRASSASAAAS